jgi:hypothetical protein
MIAISEKKPRKKRVKTFFKSNEIAHQWAHQLVPFARSPGNMSFDGPAFKSYGTVIARIIEHKGRRVYLLDSRSYSPSTSNHQGAARSAIPHDAPRFSIEGHGRGGSLDLNAKELRDHYLAIYRGDCDSKLERMRAHHLVRAVFALDEAIRVCEVFELGCKRLEQERLDIEPALETARTLLAEWRRGSADRAAKAAATRQANVVLKAEAFIANPENSVPMQWRDLWRLPTEVRSRYDAARPANERAAEARKEAYRKEKLENYLADPFSNDRPYYYELTDEQKALVDAADARKHAETLDRWVRGENVRPPSDAPVRLRVSKLTYSRGIGTGAVHEAMETSLGVTVPLTDAERAFKFIDAIRKGRGNWHRNGETFAIGQFQLDAVNEHGVVAGCHRVSWAEVDRFSTAMGWVLPVVT